MSNTPNLIGALDMIAADMVNDVKEYKGKNFLEVADQMGKIMAAITGLSLIIKDHLEEVSCEPSTTTSPESS